MFLRLLNWSYKNIRGVGDLDVRLTRDEERPYPVSLLMMPNGAGKTTTMKLIRAVLDGQAIGWAGDDVRALRPPLSDRDDGQFRAALKLNDTIIHIYIDLDFSNGTASYRTSKAVTQGGLENGHGLPQAVKRLFTPQFVKRFVFDGELAEEMLSNASNEAEQALIYLYQLDQLDGLISTVDRVVAEEQRSRTSNTAQTVQGLRNARTQAENARQRYYQLNTELQGLKADEEGKKRRITEIDKILEQRLRQHRDLKERTEQVTAHRQEVSSELKSLTYSVLDQIRDPFMLSPSIAGRLQTLAGSMDRLKLPETTSQEFFYELAEQDYCVCGHPIGPQEQQTIMEGAASYLDSDIFGVINRIKTSIKIRQHTYDLAQCMENLRRLSRDMRQVNQDWDRLQADLRAAGDDYAKALDDEQQKLKDALPLLKERIRRLEGDEIPVAKQRKEQAEQRHDEATNTVSLRAKANVTKKYLRNIKEAALIELKKRIAINTTSKLASVIKIESLEIEDIQPHLILKGKAGGSVGQNLAIAYCYLGSMFETSSFKLPFVVDSPAGSLDLSVRREVAPILPRLFEQLVVFITSGEREGFADYFLNHPVDVQFLTISKTAGANAMCSQDHEVFRGFQSEE